MALSMLGTPEVRNAILLNELGALLHDVGKLSREFVSGGHRFPYHLVLRRLTRGRDPFLEDGATALGALKSATQQREGEKAAKAEKDLAWQAKQERAIASLQPPFFPSAAFVERLDELPFVADLLEKQARTWHPQQLLSPEVRLLRRIHELVEDDIPVCWSPDEGRLSEVRYLLCRVLANQLLEIINIRKDGPGDLGSWFWNSRFYPDSEAGLAALSCFDQGVTLAGQEMEPVIWLGIRVVAQWAYSKVRLGKVGDANANTLWDHCWWLCTLYKSSLCGALIEGVWPDDHVSWSKLRVTVSDSSPEAFREIKQLVEVEYPLGNELGRNDGVIEFSFPSVRKKLEVALLGCLRSEVVRRLGDDMTMELTVAPLQPRPGDLHTVLGTI
jgi:hypothetical protein